MPIHVILGKPGSGKSLYATSRVIDELVNGQRNIVTNLPLRPERLNEYLQKRYPKANCRMVERLRILTDDEMREFWKYRGPGDVEDASSGTLALGVAPHGVAYFLDEAHIAFNARDWATLGRGALHYLSQHRKLGDIVWPITQAPGNLDKQFRSVAEDFTVLRNEYTAKYGPFRGRGRFVRRTYLQEPTNNAEPFETATFQLDKEGIASCYDTAKGIGVHGNKADIGRRAKGIPIWVVIPAGLCLALLCVIVPWLMGKGAASFVKGDAKKKGVPVDTVEAREIEVRQSGVYVTSSLPNNVQNRAEDVPQVLGLGWVAENTPEKPLWVTGLVSVPGGLAAVAYLSDGRVLITGDPKFERFDRRGIVYDGRRIFMRPLAVYPRNEHRPEAYPGREAGSSRGETDEGEAKITVGSVSTETPFEPLPGFGGLARPDAGRPPSGRSAPVVVR